MKTCRPKDLSLGLYVSALQNLIPILNALEEDEEIKKSLSGVARQIVHRIDELLRNELE